MFGDIFRGKRVLVTGHTGFKGSWLCEWLLQLGAEVHGFALPPEDEQPLFGDLGLADRIRHRSGDVRDARAVREAVAEARPDFVFHLAAQAIVRRSYVEPVETWEVNTMGTVRVMDALRLTNRSCVMVAVTTDKCYENREWAHSYRETDPMGGHDPYSSSKGAAELAVATWQRSWPDSEMRLASARAGNVIGGGDWAADRIVPDGVRALQDGRPIPVRNKLATRPWQHVLEPLSGYLALGWALAAPEAFGRPLETFRSAFNFGPGLCSNRTVAELVEEVLRHWSGTWIDRSDPAAVHEATFLNLATDKAFHFLRWQPVWDFAQTVARTVEWYRQCAGERGASRRLTERQILDYTADALARGLWWAC